MTDDWPTIEEAPFTPAERVILAAWTSRPYSVAFGGSLIGSHDLAAEACGVSRRRVAHVLRKARNLRLETRTLREVEVLTPQRALERERARRVGRVAVPRPACQYATR